MKRLTAVAALLVTHASASFAHDTWIMCTPPVIESSAPVSLHVTSGMAFPAFDTAPKPERIKHCQWRIGGKQGSFSEFQTDDPASLVVAGRVHTDGVAVIYAEFHPKEIDLQPDEVTHYLDEIGAPEGVRRAIEKAGAGATFHETYTKHAKTYLRVGEKGDATGCLGPVGFAIDFLPARDPTTLKVGDTLTVKVIRGGDELSGYSVGTVSGTGKTSMQRTNQNGMVTVEITAPGWWLVRGTELRQKADGTWESDFTTLTFFVGNP